VSHVASEAEFTPKNVQTDDQRSRLVFRVRVDVADPEGLLRPGMPGFATFGRKS
jgi:HlyD family secretion protein